MCVSKNVSGPCVSEIQCGTRVAGDDFMTLRGQDEEKVRLVEEVQGDGGSSEPLCVHLSRSSAWPQDALSPRRGPGMHPYTKGSRGSWATPI